MENEKICSKNRIDDEHDIKLNTFITNVENVLLSKILIQNIDERN